MYILDLINMFKTMINNIAIFILGFVLLITNTVEVLSQNKNDNIKESFEIQIQAGTTIGGTSPMIVPAEIQKIKSYSPDFNGFGAVQFTKWVTDKYGLSLGLCLENKGMQAEANVKSYLTEIINKDGKVSGYWTGDVTTDTKITYLSLPVLAHYKLSERWGVNSGLFLSVKINSEFEGKVSNGYLREGTPVGKKISFEGEQYATYDFSKNIRTINYGVQIGGQWKATESLLIMSKFAFGLNNIFEKDFKTISFNMYTVYLSLGAAYVF